MDWQQIGEELEKLIALGLFPGVGYDATGWAAWVYFDPPIAGELGDCVKVAKESLPEAIEELKQAIREHIVDGMFREPKDT